MFVKHEIQLGEDSTTDFQCDMNCARKLTKCCSASKNCRWHIESSLKINYAPDPNINKRQNKCPSKKKTPACLEFSSGGDIKTVPEIFEALVRDNAKLSNNFESFSNECKKLPKRTQLQIRA